MKRDMKWYVQIIEKIWEILYICNAYRSASPYIGLFVGQLSYIVFSQYRLRHAIHWLSSETLQGKSHWHKMAGCITIYSTVIYIVG